MTVIVRVPNDALVLLMGASGSGKSTFAGRHFAARDVLSSDAFRELLSGDAADQTATREAFRLLHQITRSRLRRGVLTVVDATNVVQSARASLLTMAVANSRPSLAIALDVPLAECLVRNAARGKRIVPEPVVRRHVALLARALPHLAEEGFGSIVVLRASEDVVVTVG